MSVPPDSASSGILPRRDLTLHRSPPAQVAPIRPPPARPARAAHRRSLGSTPRAAPPRGSSGAPFDRGASTAAGAASPFGGASAGSGASVRSRHSASGCGTWDSSGRWSAALGRSLSWAGTAPLLTPSADGRRRRSRCRRPPHAARNSGRAGRRAASAARSVRWEAGSALAALVECAASAGSAAAGGLVRVCAACVAMADAGLRQLRRSVSSWSLSALRRPRLRAPRIRLFGGRKKNRVDPRDEATGLEEVKAALLKAEEEARIPGQEEGGDGEEEAFDAAGEEEGGGRGGGGRPVEAKPTVLLTVHGQEPPPPPPSPGLLCANHDIEFIDSDDADGGNERAVDAEYSDRWFDARGTLTRSRNDDVVLGGDDDDYDECRRCRYYDAADGGVAEGPRKGREWVGSLEEAGREGAFGRSKSESRLDAAGREGVPAEVLRREDDDDDADGRRAFQVRGRLSIKPIFDSLRPSGAKRVDGEAPVGPDGGADGVSAGAVPDIVIDSPGACEREAPFPKAQAVEGPLPPTAPRPETASSGPVETATPNEDVSWTEVEGSFGGKEGALRERGPKRGTGGTTRREPEEEEEAVKGALDVEEEVEETSDVAEEGRESPDVTLITKGEPLPEAGRQEPKKRKISGASISKSIKNFAGSLFSQQTGGRGEEKDANRAKKKSRISPFNKDYLFRNSAKTAPEEGASEGSSKPESENKNHKESHSQEEKSPLTDSDEIPSAEAPEEVPSTQQDVKADDDDDDTASASRREVLPDLLPSPTTQETPRESPDSVEYLSTMEPCEPKSASQGSSPGVGMFVDEGGLRLRKDAMVAISSMENDDTTTRYYSVLSAPEGVNGNGASRGPPEDVSDATNEELDAEVKEILRKEAQLDGSLEREGGEDGEGSVRATDTYASVRKPRLPAPPGKPQEAPPRDPAPEEARVSGKEAPSAPVGQEPPKPSPRSKKGKYGGYSAAGEAAKPSAERPPERGTAEASGGGGRGAQASDDSRIATFPRRNAPCRRVPFAEPERNSSDSGYAGPGSTENAYSAATYSEPLYWEISETKGAPPRPSPRTKKSHRIPSEPSLSHNEAPSSSPSSPPEPAITTTTSTTTTSITTTSTTTTSITTSQHKVPEWINRRAPIPSPRTKKQRSLQSLPTVVGSPVDDSIEAVKERLQRMSNEPLQDVLASPKRAAKGRKEGKEEEERFYSGKAASISYGFTPGRPTPPSPPMRGRKASQVSLPAAVAGEERLWRQQKGRSVHGDVKGVDPQRLSSVRRSRRRTDPAQGMPMTSLKKAVQRLGETLVNLNDLLALLGLSDEASVQKTEELLTDVLFSVHSLMAGGAWAVGGPSVISASSAGGQTSSGSSDRTSVSRDQVVQVLQAAFQVSQDTVDRLNEEAQSRPAPEVSLLLNLREAKDLRPKTVKGTANAYVTLTVPSSGKSHRTRVEKDTLNPKWNQDFTLPIVNLQKDCLRIEVWHEHDVVGVKQLTAVRDIKGLSRLVRGTTAQAQHQGAHLLGQAMINVKEVSEHGLDGWYSLDKSEGEVTKDRGSIHVVASVSSSAHLENKSRNSYDALLARLIHHQLTAAANNNQENEWSTPWNGRVSSSAAAALAQYAIMLDLNDAALQLSWWCVGSRVATVDAAWTLSQLHRVQALLSKGAYQGEDLAELKSSFSVFIRSHSERLKDLHMTFPPSSGVLAQHQLTYTLKALQSIQNHADTRALMDQEGLPHVHETVTSSLAIHAKNWWMMTIEEQLRGVKTADEQISRVINIVTESHTFLTHAANFYNGIFIKEMNIPYMQTTYLMITKKINPCVRPLVMNIYNRMPTLTDQMESGDDVQYALEVGTSLWQLYRNLGRLQTLSELLPVEVRVESGVCEYHRWFSRGVMRWLELAICRAQDMIKKAVDLDCFEPVDAFCDFSSSATDTIGIFHDVKIWWLKLAWPDPENSAVLLAKILEDICSCGTKYSDLLTDKVDSMFRRQENSECVFITQQICVGLNNIERVRRELTGLPAHFGFDALLDDIKNSGSGNGAASQLGSTVERLIFSAAENMEAKVNAFIETVIEKMRPTLDKAVNDACEVQSGAPLLHQVLDPAFELLRNHLHTSNFYRFLWRVWEVIIDLFHITVMKNTERRKANFFGGVHNIMAATLKFFSPSSGVGLEENAAQTEKYTALMELLESLRMTTEELISKYYRERYEEQTEDILPSKALLVAKMLFTRPGKLIVEVIMARDIVVESDTVSISSRGGIHGPYHNQPVDSYVKVQLVPQEWFPAAPIRKTKTQRKQDPAVYEETFEYDMSRSDDGVRAGFLLLTLKDYNLGRTNTFIGEALIPLSDLPCVDSSEVHTVPNTYLKMTTPGLDIGYKSLRALQFRTGDKVACAFLKKVSKRVLDSKVKLSTPIRPDEDKSRSKSPTLKERLKFS